MRGVTGEALLAQLATLNAGATQHLAVLLLGHALAALLDDRTHSNCLTFGDIVRTCLIAFAGVEYRRALAVHSDNARRPSEKENQGWRHIVTSRTTQASRR